MVKSKAISSEFFNDLMLIKKKSSCIIYIIQDIPKKTNEKHGIKYLMPQNVENLINKDNQVFILLDSFLMHLISSKCSYVFCVISQKYAYDWLPKKVIPISSIYSFAEKI